MRSQFFEKRRQLREPVETGHARINGQRLPLVNWSQNGLLIKAQQSLAAPGGRLSAEIEVTSAGQQFTFPAELRVVRWQPEKGAMAATYVCLDVPAARRIASHFLPGPARRPDFIAEPPSHVRNPAAPVSEDPDRDSIIARKEIAGLKTSFARLFHPDTAARDESYELRVQLFKEFWTVLEAAEERVRSRSGHYS